MWLSKKSMYCFYYAKHPAYTMSNDWAACCRLTTCVYLKFGKLLKQEEHAIAGMMLYHSRLVKCYVIAAFKAGTFNEACDALEQMHLAKNNCEYYHFEAEKRGLYANFEEAYQILKPIVDMGYYQMSLKIFFKRKFYPPKAHIRLSHHYQTRRNLNYPPR